MLGTEVLISVAKPFTSILGLLFALAFGAVLATSSQVVTRDLHSSTDGYQGEARVAGFPLPYAYTLTSPVNSDTMEFQVYCSLSLVCEHGPGPQVGKGPFAWLPFLIDVALWSMVLALALCATAVWRRRRNLRRPRWHRERQPAASAKTHV
jgi:hypothetical protein